MCQHCVERGTLTQDELDERILDGDTRVMPLVDLGEDQAVEVVAGLVREAIENGMDRDRALTIGAMILAARQLP